MPASDSRYIVSDVGVRVEEIAFRSGSDADREAFHELTCAVQRESRPDDPLPTLEMSKALLDSVPDSIDVAAFVVRGETGGFDGLGYALLFRTDDNEHMTQIEIVVHPERRRRGIGTALLGALAEAAERDGRRLLMGSTSERVPAGAAFAQAVGAEPGLDAHTNRLVLDEVDRELVDRWITDGPRRAPGYELVAIDGLYPDDLLEEIVSCHNIMNTAPRDDLELDDRTMTPAFVREMESFLSGQGLERWSLFARHTASGSLVGYTEVSWNAEQPETVQQMATAVHPDQRGHALGKWLKATMLIRILDERLAAGAIDVRTGNADSNAAMLGINHALGFRSFIAATTWQVSVDRAKSFVGSRTEAPAGA